MDASGSSFDAEDALLATVAVLLVQEKAAKEQLLQRLLDAEKQAADDKAAAAQWECQRQARARSVADIKALREEVEHVRSASAAGAERADATIAALKAKQAALLQRSEADSARAQAAQEKVAELQSRLDTTIKALAAAEAERQGAATALQLLRAQFAAELRRWHGAGSGAGAPATGHASPGAAMRETSPGAGPSGDGFTSATGRRKRRRAATGD